MSVYGELENNISTLMQQQTEAIKQRIIDTQGDLERQSKEINEKENEINKKNEQIYGQSEQIESKKRLMETRNRMLQLSIEKNRYKKKVIWTLLAFVIAILAIMLFTYAILNKKKMSTGNLK